MAFWTSVGFAAGACALVLQKQGTRDVRLMRSITIKAPASSVFDVIGNVERIPDWYRRPGLLPPKLSRNQLSRWGEHIPREWRVDSSNGESSQITIHWVKNREFVYSCRSRDGMRYDCIFRIAPKDRESTLVWEVRYQPRRWVDAMFHDLTARQISEVMKKSLDTIRRLSESPLLRQKTIPDLAPCWEEPQVKAS